MRRWFVITGDADAVPREVLTLARRYADTAELRGTLAGAPAEVLALHGAVAGRPVGAWTRAVRRLRAALGGNVLRVYAGDDEGWQLVVAAAPWADSVDLVADGQATVANVHDAGRTAVVRLDADEGLALAQRLAGVATVDPLDENQPWFRMVSPRDPRSGAR